MNLKEIYTQFDELSRSQEVRGLIDNYKNKSISDEELVRLDKVVAHTDLKLNIESKITDSLFKKNRKYQLNNGDVLKITRSRTRNDGGICFKVSSESKSNKLGYADLIKYMYGLYRNYYGELRDEYISDEFKSACDLIANEV